MDSNDEAIAPSMLYAYAAIMEGVPFCNGAPNLCVDVRRCSSLQSTAAFRSRGKFKTGQTWMKTVIARASRHACSDSKAGTARTFGQPRRRSARRSRFVQDERGKQAQRPAHNPQPDKYPDLYKDFSHVVRINYYPAAR